MPVRKHQLFSNIHIDKSRKSYREYNRQAQSKQEGNVNELEHEGILEVNLVLRARVKFDVRLYLPLRSCSSDTAAAIISSLNPLLEV